MNVNNNLQGLQSLVGGQAVEMTPSGMASQTAPAASGADEATLSSEASLASRVSSDSDVRMEKVNQIQQALAAGTYSVPSAEVADRMITQMLGKG